MSVTLPQCSYFNLCCCGFQSVLLSLSESLFFWQCFCSSSANLSSVFVLSDKIKIFVLHLPQKKCFQFGKSLAEDFGGGEGGGEGGGYSAAAVHGGSIINLFSAIDSSCQLVLVPNQCVCWWLSGSLSVCSHCSGEGFPCGDCEFVCFLVAKFLWVFFCKLLYWIWILHKKPPNKQKHEWHTFHMMS